MYGKTVYYDTKMNTVNSVREYWQKKKQNERRWKREFDNNWLLMVFLIFLRFFLFCLVEIHLTCLFAGCNYCRASTSITLEIENEQNKKKHNNTKHNWKTEEIRK